MKPGPRFSLVQSVLMIAVWLLLLSSAAVYGQQPAADSSAAPAVEPSAPTLPAPGSSSNLGSLVGIMMVSIGALMIVSVVARSFRWSGRSKRASYPPVLFDHLDPAGVIRLQQQITRAGKMRPLTHVYDNLAEDPADEHEQAVEQTPDQPAEVEPPLHAVGAAASDVIEHAAY